MNDTSARSRLLGISVGYMASQAVYTAAQLGIADLLAKEPMDGARLAAACDCDVAALDRLLLALVSCAVLRQEEAGTYALTEVGEALRADVPGSARQLVLLYGTPPVWRAWSRLGHSVATGTTAFSAEHGMGAFEYCAADPATARLFHAAMADETVSVPEQLLACLDLTGVRTLADIGGGNGTLLAGLLGRVPGLRGILVDTEHGVADAPRVLADAGVADRCEITVGDFFAGVPRADLYVLKSIVHDWSDTDAVRLLSAVRRAMHADGRLVLVERLVPSRLPSAYDPLMVRNLLNMPTIIGGRERTEDEFGALFSAAGLALRRVDRLPEPGDHYALLAGPV